MKKVQISFAAALFLACYGCSTILPRSADPVVVNAEKSTAIAVDAIDTFLKIEYDNRATVKANFPEIHTYANQLRLNAPKWISTARSLTSAYKENRSAANKANLLTAVAVLSAAVNEIQVYQPKIAK